MLIETQISDIYVPLEKLLFFWCLTIFTKAITMLLLMSFYLLLLHFYRVYLYQKYDRILINYLFYLHVLVMLSILEDRIKLRVSSKNMNKLFDIQSDFIFLLWYYITIIVGVDNHYHQINVA